MDADATGLISTSTVRALVVAAESPDDDALARAALLIARLEHRALDAGPYLAALDSLGRQAAARLTRVQSSSLADRIEALNDFIYAELGFHGNASAYDDPRNSFLNDVIDRRTGIPITLALVYIELARRAGLQLAGVSFPGHFLVRAPAYTLHDLSTEDLIVDPFHGGAILNERDCRKLLARYAGADAVYHDRLLTPATQRAILVRMLVNLKRVYVKMRSFPHARAATHLLLQLEPSAQTELRDRGLLAYHMQDFRSALRDLERYLRLTSTTERDETDEESRAEHEQIWEHVKNLRRRVAALN